MWYSARLLFELMAVDERSDHEPFFEEKLIVFRCEDSENIVEHIHAVSRQDESEFENTAGYAVRWILREILEVQEVMDESIEDGTEVFFRFWTNPSKRDLKFLRETHTEPWWRNSG